MVTEREMAANGEPTRRDMGREKFLERVMAAKGQIARHHHWPVAAPWRKLRLGPRGLHHGRRAGRPRSGKTQNFHDAVIKVFVDMYNKA